MERDRDRERGREREGERDRETRYVLVEGKTTPFIRIHVQAV